MKIDENILLESYKKFDPNEITLDEFRKIVEKDDLEIEKIFKKDTIDLGLYEAKIIKNTTEYKDFIDNVMEENLEIKRKIWPKSTNSHDFIFEKKGVSNFIIYDKKTKEPLEFFRLNRLPDMYNVCLRNNLLKINPSTIENEKFFLKSSGVLFGAYILYHPKIFGFTTIQSRQFKILHDLEYCYPLQLKNGTDSRVYNLIMRVLYPIQNAYIDEIKQETLKKITTQIRVANILVVETKINELKNHFKTWDELLKNYIEIFSSFSNKER